MSFRMARHHLIATRTSTRSTICASTIARISSPATRRSRNSGLVRRPHCNLLRASLSVPPMRAGRVPLEHAVKPAQRAGNLVFASGLIASEEGQGLAPNARIDPAFPYYGSAIKRQTRFVLEKLTRIFANAGTSLQDAVKAHVFHTDLRNFDAFDEVWREFFPTRPPCRATVGMGGLPVPGCVVAIDLIAALPGTSIEVFSSSAPRAPVNYSEAIAAGDLVFA